MQFDSDYSGGEGASSPILLIIWVLSFPPMALDDDMNMDKDINRG